MIRTALRPGWLALLGLLVVIVVGFYQLGMWQIGVSSNEASREHAAAQAARPTEPLGEVTAPHQAFPDDGAGLSVTAEGEYAAEHQFLVAGRVLDGEPGYWVVTPLRTGASGEPALLPVVRGFVTDPAGADRPGPGTVQVTGTLAPSESPGEGADLGTLPEGQRAAIDTADLVNLWAEDAAVYNAFVFLVEEDPTVTAPAVRPIPPPVFGDSGIVWRNFGYGLQWFVFAAFAVYMYVRFLRQAVRDESDGDGGDAEGPGGAPHAPRPRPADDRTPVAH
ncbi:SURF1 family protein [Ornithinimicrobium pekingense]|uniref:SURF1-like protein n=1 Tax=Ornithinimicrobium pekingense TaxID=384677 RepID=A0ABQ2F5W3_9MICO|nr:SURF1 family protein [Ornithinimicrobium pekingense]GGK65132.1 SURF1-like protein [Ornithinimicrobium pekingense]